MNDLISKYDVLEICKEQIWNGADDYYPISANKIAKKVKELPTVDAVPVIRCKVCLKKKLCSLYREANQENGFCAWGVREE